MAPMRRSTSTLVDKDLAQLDRLVARVPVLPQQSAVSAATSFALLASPSGEGRNEGLQIPEHVDHSATVTVTAGVGRLPAILAYADQLLDASESREPSGLDYVAALVPSWLLGGSFAPAVTADLARRINAAFERGASRLKQLTRPDVGLIYYEPTWYTPTWVDVSLNAFALWATDKLSTAEQARLPRDLWITAINSGLHQQAYYARQYDSGRSLRTLTCWSRSSSRAASTSPCSRRTRATLRRRASSPT
jgi:hypothetical protein